MTSKERLPSKVYCCYKADQDSNPDRVSPHGLSTLCLITQFSPHSLFSPLLGLSIQTLLVILNTTQKLCVVSSAHHGNSFRNVQSHGHGSSKADNKFFNDRGAKLLFLQGWEKLRRPGSTDSRAKSSCWGPTCSAKASPTPKSINKFKGYIKETLILLQQMLVWQRIKKKRLCNLTNRCNIEQSSTSAEYVWYD